LRFGIWFEDVMVRLSSELESFHMHGGAGLGRERASASGTAKPCGLAVAL
jgi:hypothetical protein